MKINIASDLAIVVGDTGIEPVTFPVRITWQRLATSDVFGQLTGYVLATTGNV